MGILRSSPGETRKREIQSLLWKERPQCALPRSILY